ncbi:fimbria/pilus periplasmic chaperone [Pantoea sp. AMG 501]|uniref:fimbrial biogenesis chaperone n=1 Tax=Pantoea sp. AMG 501 TaxID=2008894 RepID=UPI001482F08D|nr:fimbria/pilus periplasmic chaperone [Pantoea sp. AMG 501]
MNSFERCVVKPAWRHLRLLSGATCLLFCSAALADGIVLGASRIVFPAGTAQSAFPVSNTSKSSTYLVQSRIITEAGDKTGDFVVTPPLYTSTPGSENVLRIVSTGTAHPQNRESLYFLSIKFIPSVDKKSLVKNEGGSLLVATQMQIKLFVRPAGLTPPRDQAERQLVFTRKGNSLHTDNPTPYYLTLTKMKAGDKTLGNIMVPPHQSVTSTLPAGSGIALSWSSIGDDGEPHKGQSVIR